MVANSAWHDGRPSISYRPPLDLALNWVGPSNPLPGAGPRGAYIV
jgi:hypothetical protein